MQYTLVKNIFSRKNRFEILDIHEQPTSKVSKERSGVFAKHYKLHQEKLEIKQYYKGLWSNYEILAGGQKIANLHRKYRFFKSVFFMDCLDGASYKISCDSRRKNYQFHKEDEIVATLKRSSKNLRRCYELTCFQMEDQAILLASVVVLDAYLEQDSGS
ncbi:MAG: hypothetical protein AAGI49_12615 [Bacteroidota bacterium]